MEPALRSLEVLAGQYPSALLETASDFPVQPDPIAAGLPSQLLERRPDIRASERRVAAAFNRVEQARAATLPTFTLTGSLGTSSGQLDNYISPDRLLWNVAGGILFPIFNAGELDAEVDIKTAEQRVSIANYQQAALDAFAEVENALSNEYLYRLRQGYLNDAYDNSRLAELIADENFLAGEIELLDLLQIKRSTINIEIDRVRSERELLE